MSQTHNFFYLSLFVLSFSIAVNANNSVPVTDLANDIGDSLGASSTPLQPKVIEPTPQVLKINTAQVGALAIANTQMFDLVETLKVELQQLRGQVEQLTYHLERLKQDQKQRYLDLDRRIVSLSAASAATNSAQATPSVDQVVNTETLAPIAASEFALEPTVSTQNIYDPEAEKTDYKAAFTLIRERQYDASIEALLTFIKNYPQGVLLGNAHYWLGEVYMVQGDASLAALSFEYVISEFPEHRKMPDALYKAGVAYQNLGDMSKANKLLNRVLVEYADSSAARLAQERVN
ncbi:MAG: tol-pal system protein YbgF [Oceanospirillaceae bacterium]|nr:tol-pal system protein YbgF [Oceanospirillaceae bacterium]